MRSDKENDGYFVPLTIKELIDGLNGIIQEADDITGEELVIDAEYIYEDDHKCPSGSIILYVQQNTLDPDEPKYGTIILTPGKTRWLM